MDDRLGVLAAAAAAVNYGTGGGWNVSLYTRHRHLGPGREHNETAFRDNNRSRLPTAARAKGRRRVLYAKETANAVRLLRATCVCVCVSAFVRFRLESARRTPPTCIMASRNCRCR